LIQTSVVQKKKKRCKIAKCWKFRSTYCTYCQHWPT